MCGTEVLYGSRRELCFSFGIDIDLDIDKDKDSSLSRDSRDRLWYHSAHSIEPSTSVKELKPGKGISPLLCGSIRPRGCRAMG